MHAPRRFRSVLLAVGVIPLLLHAGAWESTLVAQHRSALRRHGSRLADPRTISEDPSQSIFPRLSLNDPNLQQAQESFADEALADQPDLPPPPELGEPLQIVTAWVPANDLGFTDFELWAKWAFPTFTPYHLLTLKPGYGLHLVDGPTAPDLPPRLHDVYFDVGWLLPFSPEFALEVGLKPGLYTDFEQGTDEAFRLGARAVAIYTASDQWRFVLGGAYLDRDDVDFMPIAGAIWKPDPDTELQLVIPEPRLSRRIRQCCGIEDWLFIVGEFGGGSWAVQRTSGMLDVANYYDLRVSVGWEQKGEVGPTTRLEVGYVFSRRLEYRSGGPVFEPGDTFMIRASIGF